MYAEVRRACETYAVRIGRGLGHGSPILWSSRKVTRCTCMLFAKRKAAEYAKRKRKALRAGGKAPQGKSQWGDNKLQK